MALEKRTVRSTSTRRGRRPIRKNHDQKPKKIPAASNSRSKANRDDLASRTVVVASCSDLSESDKENEELAGLAGSSSTADDPLDHGKESSNLCE